MKHLDQKILLVRIISVSSGKIPAGSVNGGAAQDQSAKLAELAEVTLERDKFRKALQQVSTVGIYTEGPFGQIGTSELREIAREALWIPMPEVTK